MMIIDKYRNLSSVFALEINKLEVKEVSKYFDLLKLLWKLNVDVISC